MIDSLSRAGLVPATPSSAPASSVRAPVAPGADVDTSATVGDDSDDEGVTTSLGAQAEPSPTYGPTGHFDAVAVVATDDADPDVDATAADDGSDDDDDAPDSPDVGTGGRGATTVREYLAVWGPGSGSGSSSGDADDDGDDTAKAGAGSLSVTA